MKSQLIILRGNAASGKTTIAKELQERFNQGTLLVSQDMIRRDMLKIHNTMGTLSQDLIYEITKYGKGRCEIVILEGIFSTRKYRNMLIDLVDYFDGNAHAYYFDVSLEETIRRHHSRDKQNEFGEELLHQWYTPHDIIGITNERMIHDTMTQEEICNLILNDVN
ncbi:kinase [Bacillus thuringiensis]|uniref:kinase n=1 Tax=Bacillus thuringiensis TaxID=1428 RepID=UPI0007890D4B|nr:kinase [Bacillus thuringiensis]HDR7713405.1 kinase [Bacillus cereus]AMR88284.1 hypothetical protein A3L20_30195 [Bacillus thuringiensis]MBG9636048.1 hypothetical protein [Bacillus thuringiensis]MBG9675906.1 hypothetical protein [Bacillus thuringiensis]MEC3298332.1 kinase [Bacillus thuringiensis]